jgi:hypothetical protein
MTTWIELFFRDLLASPDLTATADLLAKRYVP